MRTNTDSLFRQPRGLWRTRPPASPVAPACSAMRSIAGRELGARNAVLNANLLIVIVLVLVLSEEREA